MNEQHDIEKALLTLIFQYHVAHFQKKLFIMKNLFLFTSISLLFSTLFFTSCNLEKEVDIDLPDYETQLVLECYLEPGKPFSALLTRSESYFATVSTSQDDIIDYYLGLLEQGADIQIRHNGNVYSLDNTLVLESESNKIYNYRSEDLVPESYNTPFELSITTEDGQSITATTQILEPVPIDSVVIEFDPENADSARVLTYFVDIEPGKTNFIRRMLHEGSLNEEADQDFVTNDRFVADRVVFGSAYEYSRGDTIFNTLFHLDEAYYDFLISVFNSIDANGNPFAQPGVLISNLEGDADAIGIFTGLSYFRDITIIE